jgi:hypothetical protein
LEGGLSATASELEVILKKENNSCHRASGWLDGTVCRESTGTAAPAAVAGCYQCCA